MPKQSKEEYNELVNCVLAHIVQRKITPIVRNNINVELIERIVFNFIKTNDISWEFDAIKDGKYTTVFNIGDKLFMTVDYNDSGKHLNGYTVADEYKNVLLTLYSKCIIGCGKIELVSKCRV